MLLPDLNNTPPAEDEMIEDEMIDEAGDEDILNADIFQNLFDMN